METLKEVLVDVVVFVGAWLIVTATGIHKSAEGWSCGRVQESSEARQP